MAVCQSLWHWWVIYFAFSQCYAFVCIGLLSLEKSWFLHFVFQWLHYCNNDFFKNPARKLPLLVFPNISWNCTGLWWYISAPFCNSLPESSNQLTLLWSLSLILKYVHSADIIAITEGVVILGVGEQNWCSPNPNTDQIIGFPLNEKKTK